jgi:hypothetical protein
LEAGISPRHIHCPLLRLCVAGSDQKFTERLSARL